MREVEIKEGRGGSLLVAYVDRKKGGKYLAAQFSDSSREKVSAWIASNPKLTEKKTSK